MLSKETLPGYLYRYIFFLFACILCGPIKASENTLKTTTDSLLLVLKKTNDIGKQIETYRTLASLHFWMK